MADLNIPVKSPGDTAFASETNIIVDAINVLQDDVALIAPLTNVVNVNSLADFPTPVSGVIELVQVEGEYRVYEMASSDIDIGSNVFSVTKGNIVMRGIHRTGSKIITDSTTDMFTVVDSDLYIETLGTENPNGKAVNFSSPGTTALKSFVTQNWIVWDCDSIATISGCYVNSWRTFTCINATSNGILWTGTENSQINMTDTLGVVWGGTLMDLGTATFDLIQIAGGNRFLSPLGSTTLSGAVNSANLNANGRAIINDNIFNGDGTDLNGIDTEDLKYLFSGNDFVDNLNKNTEVVAGDYLSSSQTVTINSAGVYVAIGGANWVSDIAKRFTTTTAGLLTYIGLETVDVTIAAVSTVEKVGGGSDTICSKIAINGVVSDKTIACTENTNPTNITSLGLFELKTGDTIQLFVGNEDSTSNIIVSTSNVIVSQR